jgi:replicative DNA helicase
MFLYREEVYNNTDPSKENVAEVIIAKHRNGPTGKIELVFQKELARFLDAAHQHIDPSALMHKPPSAPR